MLKANSKLIHSETKLFGENRMIDWIDGSLLVLLLKSKIMSKLVIGPLIGQEDTMVAFQVGAPLTTGTKTTHGTLKLL